MYWLRERVHPTWHFTALAYGFVGGVTLARWFALPAFVAIGLGALLVLLGFWKKRRVLILLVMIGAVLLGNAFGTVTMNARQVYAELYGKHVVLRATIADDTDQAKRGKVHLKLRDISIDGHDLSGRIFATVSAPESLRRSDIVTVDGLLDRGFGNFAASMTGVVTNAQRPEPGDVALDVRDGFAANVKRAVDEPAASLGIGYLLGKKSALPDDLITALQITGLTHIVVASGYNLTILVRAGRRIFARISKYLAAVTGVTLVVGFVLMTGVSATMMRAGIVALLGLWAWYYGRKFHPVTLLGAAGALTLLIDPSYAWGDLGWLLSFAAFAGVMIIAPIVTSYFFGSEKVPFVGQLLIETISAQIATLPIMIVAFHQLSAIAPIANVLILPLIPLAMLGVLITGVGAWLIPSLAGVIGWPIETLLNIQLRIIDWCASLPGALLKPTWNWLVVCVYIVAVAGLVAYMKWRTGYKLRDASLVE